MWNHVEKLPPPADQPVLAMHSEYATPVVMIRKDGHWWIAHANGDLTKPPPSYDVIRITSRTRKIHSSGTSS